MNIFTFLVFILGWFLLLLIPILVVYLIALWKLFKKAGRNGWEAIVPFYNTWVLSEIAGVAWWYPLIIIVSNFGLIDESFISSILSLASLVANFFIMYNLSKKFHRGIGFAILATIFPFVLIPIMAFSDKYQYDKDVLVSQNGPIGDNYDNTSFNNSNNYSVRYCQNCGNQIDKNAKYCSRCGNEIK